MMSGSLKVHMGGQVAKPPVRSRRQWGARDPKDPPQYTTVTHIIVHHTESPNDTVDWDQKVRFIQRLHMDTRGWCDIAYNYLIAPDGTIYEGRAGGDNVKGTHSRGLNDHTMAVALLGNYERVAPSEDALSSLVRLLGWKCALENLDPFAVTRHPTSNLQLNTISGHRDSDPAKTCPGEEFYRLLPALRGKVSALVSQATD